MQIIMNAGPYVFISFVRNPYSSLMTHEKGMSSSNNIFFLNVIGLSAILTRI